MRKLWVTLVLAALAIAMPGAPSAGAAFGLKELDVTASAEGGAAETQAGAHPFAFTTTLAANTVFNPVLEKELPDGDVKDLTIAQVTGLAGSPTATPRCSNAEFLTENSVCPPTSMIGTTDITINDATYHLPVYNIIPPPGVAAKIGFIPLKVPVVVNLSLSPKPPHDVIASARNIEQVYPFYRSVLSIWGNPADPAHDAERGGPANITNVPFLTSPRACEGPLETIFEATSWQGGDPFAQGILTHGDTSDPLGFTGCNRLGFSPQITSQPTSEQAESPAGLNFSLDIEDENLTNPTGIANSDVRKTVVALPRGVTANPSVAEGLAVCTRADYEAEALDSGPGQGCPQASKLGTVEVETPLLEGELFKGQVFIAQQDDPATTEPGAENPFDSMLALYLVIRDPELGIFVKQAGKIEPSDEHGPNAGQLITTFEDIPQLPFSHLRLHLREGGRSPLVTPPHCGTYTTEAILTPWANPDQPFPTNATFQITKGVGGGPCPPAGAPPFKPGFQAGSLSNSAGSYSPFYMRLTRADGEQDITRFSSVLPPGLLAKIAGLSKCPDGQIAAAKAKTGRAELASPSCPASSKIGRTLAGAGVGSELTYVPGDLYLAGPVGGDPLSVVAITPAVAGPFDAGTVVVREALSVDPRTAEVKADGAASDPIPHILKGIVLKLRDLRVYVDRPSFTLNPTSCARLQTKATLFGSYLDVFNPADDVPVSLAARFQAADCASLGFKPRLKMKLKGGTHRGDNPAFTTVVTPRPGDANIAATVVTLPRSAFLDQSHIRTICTRVQYAAKACPAGSIYGHVTARTPLLDETLSGPVYLRSSNHNLPDLVFALHGIVDAELVGRIDSNKGGIRASFESIPDVPVSRFVLDMQGGKKGLIVNSRGLCARASRAIAQLKAQSGKQRSSRPLVRAVGCGGRH
jgi:hypothetical protein